MAEPIIWRGPTGRPPSPAVVGGVAQAPSPVGGGGGSLLGSLAQLADIGGKVYDRFWGPGRLADDLKLQKAMMDLQTERTKNWQSDYERRVEAVTGQKFGPELAQATTGTREAMVTPGSGRGEVGLIGGSSIVAPQIPGSGPEPGSLGNLVVRPYVDLPKLIGKEASAFRGEAEAGAERLPEGPAKERTKQQITHGAQITKPSDVLTIYKGQAEAGAAGAQEAEQQRKAAAATAGQSAMDNFRRTGDRKFLIEAMSHDAAGPGKLLELDQKQAEAAVAHFEKLQDAKLKQAKAISEGSKDPVLMESMTRDINLMQVGFSRLTGNPNVMLHPVIATPGVIYGQNYKASNFVLPYERANRYVMGQMDPSNSQDLLTLGGIHLGINLPQGGRFDPQQAAVLKRYIAEYPGADLNAIREAQYWIDQNTQGISPGGSYPVDPAEEAAKQAAPGARAPIMPGSPEDLYPSGTPQPPPAAGGPGAPAATDLRQDPNAVQAPPQPPQQPRTGLEGVGDVARAVTPKALSPQAEGVRAPAAKGIPGAPALPGAPTRERPPAREMRGAEGSVPPAPTGPPAPPSPASPTTGPRYLEDIGTYLWEQGASLFGKPTREQTASSQGVYGPMAIQLSQELGVDTNLVLKIIQAESSWDPKAEGKDKWGRKTDAIGLMQLRPGAAKDVGLSPEERWDPAKNLRGGISYIKLKLNEFKGHLPLALAGYHMGAGDVKKGKVWGPATRAYVEKLTGEKVTDQKIAEWLGSQGYIYQPQARTYPVGAGR